MRIEMESTHAEKVLLVVVLMLLVIYAHWGDLFQILGVVNYAEM